VECPLDIDAGGVREGFGAAGFEGFGGCDHGFVWVRWNVGGPNPITDAAPYAGSGRIRFKGSSASARNSQPSRAPLLNGSVRLCGMGVNWEMGRCGKLGFYFAGGAGFSAAWKNCPLKWWWWAAGRAG
jgi:hypothetical protein